MKTNGIVLLTFIFLTSTLFGCGKQDASVGLESIDVPEIEKIEHTGTTGGKDGNYSYSFSDDEVIEFINLLNQVKLGDEVDENKALSSGAVSYYTIHLATDETLTISPGKYYKFIPQFIIIIKLIISVCNFKIFTWTNCQRFICRKMDSIIRNSTT